MNICTFRSSFRLFLDFNVLISQIVYTYVKRFLMRAYGQLMFFFPPHNGPPSGREAIGMYLECLCHIQQFGLFRLCTSVDIDLHIIDVVQDTPTFLDMTVTCQKCHHLDIIKSTIYGQLFVCFADFFFFFFTDAYFIITTPSH